eukprot:jgi/Chrzof1/3576/Cz13g01020.t1
MLSKCMHGSPCIVQNALCMAAHASITLISQHCLSLHYYCMCYYDISVMHYTSNASAIHHSSAGYARHCSASPKTQRRGTRAPSWPSSSSETGLGSDLGHTHGPAHELPFCLHH